MSRGNLEVVRRVYEAVAVGDSEAVLAIYDPDVEFDFSRSPFAGVLENGVFRGHEGLRNFIRERYAGFAEIEDECHELIEAGDKVISVVTSRGRGRESGIDVEKTHYAVWSVDAGKVTRVTWFGARHEALEAARLPD